jgi:hypothetical protein
VEYKIIEKVSRVYRNGSNNGRLPSPSIGDVW